MNLSTGLVQAFNYIFFLPMNLLPLDLESLTRSQTEYT